MAASTLSDELTDVIKILDDLDNRVAFVSSQDELGNAMCDIVAIGHRVQATTARVFEAATDRLVAGAAGQRTLGQYVASRTNTQALEVNRLAKTVKWLRDFPMFQAAHGQELTAAHIDYLRTKLDTNFNNHCELRDWQQFFVDTAASCSFAGFVQVCDYWVVHIDPDGKEPTDQLESNKLSLRTGTGGRGLLAGECDAVTAQALTTAIEHETEKIRQADKTGGIDRTPSQRRMAALAALVARGFAREDGTFPAPLVNIVMSESVAEWAINTLNSDPDSGSDPDPASDYVPVHPTNIDGRCELIDGTPIHPFLALHALGLATGQTDPIKLRRVIIDANSRPMDVSVNARSFPEWMRTTHLIETRGNCSTDGCDAPPSWIQIDHIDPVNNGGETRYDNGQPQCRPDNQAKSAATGHIPWRDRPPPPQRRITRRTTYPKPNEDPDHQRF